MIQISVAEFCEKHGYTKHQLRYAIQTGRLQTITKSFLDEQHALQAMSYTKPIKSELIQIMN